MEHFRYQYYCVPDSYLLGEANSAEV